jgi:hypothetical protein
VVLGRILKRVPGEHSQGDAPGYHGVPLRGKAAKVATARTLWVPAINNHGGFGRRAFLEVADPWDAQSVIRQSLAKAAVSLV